MYLHTDTETTGIPVPGIPADGADHPNIVSLCGLLDEDPDKLLGELHCLIKPDGFRIEDFPEAFKIHGITTERAMDEGISLTEALEQYLDLGRRAKTFSAYSAHFDFKLLKIACARIPDKELGDAMRAEFERLTGICTMTAAAQHLIGKRRMKLKDAYRELFQEETQTEEFHGSSGDAAASRRIFWELKKRDALPEPVSLAKEYDTPPPAYRKFGEPAPETKPVGIDEGLAVAPVRKKPAAL